MSKIIAWLRGQAIALVALFLAAGGGYAVAATTTSSKVVTACASKSTGELFLHHRGTCKRGQTKVSWNQRGPAGAPGPTGPTGSPGAPAVSFWAVVSPGGVVAAGPGLAVQHVSAGTYNITAPQCANGLSAPTVSVTDGNPPAGQGAGSFPYAWVGDSASGFTVYTGVVVNGVFTASDRAFNVHDVCP